ncbi:MAG: NAD-dependent epimerase/dehydratase family protein [Candidatus Nitrosopumilus sp. bin_32a]
MKIFVTGGAGFIGKHLIKKLQNEHELIVYENFSSSSEEDFLNLLKNNISLIKGDLTNYSLLKKSLEGVDLVIHLAAKIDILESIKHPANTHKINVEGSLNMLRSCIENNIKNFIFASSAAIYGNPSEIPVSEKTIPNPVSPYGAEKLSLEFYAKSFANAYNMNCISLRFFNVYGKGQSNEYAGVITKFTEKIQLNQSLPIFGDGENTRDFIHVDDLVDGIVKSISNIEGKKGNVYNLASGKSTSIKELAELMISISKKDLKLNFTDPRPGDLLHSLASIELAKEDLGFEPKISLKEGLSILMKE